MKNNPGLIKKFWAGFPPWLFIGAAAVLLPIIIFMAVENISRQKENSIRLLVGKGAALIRAFEAGTRTGMMGMRAKGFQLQRLLTETAQQADIRHLIVTNPRGIVLAHNIPDEIGSTYGKGLNFGEILRSGQLYWRRQVGPDGGKTFEIFRRFSPSEKKRGLGRHMAMNPTCMPPDTSQGIGFHPDERIIFVGLEMDTIEAARIADTRHTVVMAIILILVGLAGIALLFLTQSYRATRSSLARIKAFSDNLVENLPIGIVAIDDGKKIASINHTAESVLDLTGTIIGKKVEDVLPKELTAQIMHPDIAHRAVEAELDCRVSDHRVVPLETGASILKDEDGTFLGYVLLLKDLSEVRALRKEITRNQRLASVGRLAAGVAHEIRNPLSSIKGFATYFKERYHDVPEDQETAVIMIQEVERLNRVVGQLLEFSRPITILKRKIPIRPFVEASLKLIQRRADKHNIALRYTCETEIDTVVLDPDKISQILLNLYLNAIDAMAKGGVLKVEASMRSAENALVICVVDSGHGIAADDLAHVFDPYFTTKTSGTGLGLAIIHNILEAHPGRIHIQNRSVKGTRATVILPDARVTEQTTAL